MGYLIPELSTTRSMGHQRAQFPAHSSLHLRAGKEPEQERGLEQVEQDWQLVQELELGWASLMYCRLNCCIRTSH
jgi:hypothetical protein